MNYGTERDIPNGFVYTITQSNDGFLWVGTGNGLTRFDGFNFFRYNIPILQSAGILQKALKINREHFGSVAAMVQFSMRKRIN